VKGSHKEAVLMVELMADVVVLPVDFVILGCYLCFVLLAFYLLNAIVCSPYSLDFWTEF
jgi:hypothetical protein